MRYVPSRMFRRLPVPARRAVAHASLPVLLRAHRRPTAGDRWFLPVGLVRLALSDAMVVWMDPARVQRHAVRQFVRDRLRDGNSAAFACAGAWDLQPLEFEHDFRHRAMRELLATDFDYRATPTYATMLTDLDAGRTPRWRVPLTTPEAVDRYWESRVVLLRSMLDSGYVRTVEDEDAEIGVGRDGGLVKMAHGNHRFAAARSLGLASMPFRIDAVHVDWLRTHVRERGPSRQALAEALTALSVQEAGGGTTTS